MAGDESESRVFRRAGISYMRIPAKDPRESAAFYRDVFGWAVDATRADPSFEDGSGHVIGHFIPDAAASGEAGVRPYVYVESVEDTLERVSVHGGAPVEAPYAEGDLRVATFRDPAGNVIGVWQRGSRGSTRAAAAFAWSRASLLPHPRRSQRTTSESLCRDSCSAPNAARAGHRAMTARHRYGRHAALRLHRHAARSARPQARCLGRERIRCTCIAKSFSVSGHR
jgi:predicted enzyme related to lactoylglutathione lyase